jgi:hypothetical protein
MHFCEIIHLNEDFIEQINETGEESLSYIVNQLSRSQPSAFKGDKANELQKLLSIKCATKKSETVQDEATKVVKEMFPDFGNGFVERVVEFYEGKTEDIINALLEDNLHPEIAALDRNMLSNVELEQKKKKSIIPGLYHKKAKPIAEDEMGRRKDQIFVNAIAKQYAYVTEEVEVEVTEADNTEQAEDVEQEITDE